MVAFDMADSLAAFYQQFNISDNDLMAGSVDISHHDYSQSNTSYIIYDDLLNLVESFQHKSKGNGNSFYAFVTPFIIVIGLIGNIVSLRVFTSRKLRNLSASFYLAALSASDSIVLLSYVLFGWLLRGLPYWPGGHSIDIIHKPGLCQGFMFFSYLFRFISVYLIVIFTIERYIAVCKPLQRKIICTKGFARKLILSVHVVAGFISLYKPLLSGLYIPSAKSNSDTNNLSNESHIDGVQNNSGMDYTVLAAQSSGQRICTWNPDYESFHFVMELVYGLSITAVPFLLVTVFNFLMLKKLISRYMLSGSMRAVFKKSNMRIEFTITVIAVSTCFVCLNIPYFIVWLMQNLQTFNPEGHDVVQRNSEVLRVTRTIFSLNYSINFFVYCLTGSYYRGVIQGILGLKSRKTLKSQITGQDLSLHAGSSATDAMLSNMTEL